MTEKRKEQLDKLQAATRSLMESEGWASWLRSRRVFREYSINNQLLLAIQQPQVGDEVVAEAPTRVAGYKAWQKLDRQVRKGAKGLGIFAPVTFIKRDEDGNPELDEQGNKVKGLAFRLVSVFDVSQTEGEPLPPTPGEGSIAGESGTEALRDRLMNFAAYDLGITVTGRDLSDHRAGGWYDSAQNVIVFDGSVSTDEQVRILTHEIAHALGVGYAEYGRQRAEVIVETATAIALEGILDTVPVSAPYVASWAQDEKGLEIMRNDLGKIDEIAGRLEEAVRAEVGEQVAA